RESGSRDASGIQPRVAARIDAQGRGPFRSISRLQRELGVRNPKRLQRIRQVGVLEGQGPLGSLFDTLPVLPECRVPPATPQQPLVQAELGSIREAAWIWQVGV